MVRKNENRNRRALPPFLPLLLLDVPIYMYKVNKSEQNFQFIPPVTYVSFVEKLLL